MMLGTHEVTDTHRNQRNHVQYLSQIGIQQNSFELRTLCLSRHSPNKFVEYLALQYSTSPRFLLYQETSWYLHTLTGVFVPGQDTRITMIHYLAHKPMLPDWSERFCKSKISITNSWCFHVELVSAPTPSLWYLPLANNEIQYYNRTRSLNRQILLGESRQNNLQPFSQGINLDILRSARHKCCQTLTMSM